MVSNRTPNSRPMTAAEKVMTAVEELGKIKVAYEQNKAMVRGNPNIQDDQKGPIIEGLTAAQIACDIAIDTLTYELPCAVMLPPHTELPAGLPLHNLLLAMESPSRTRNFSAIIGVTGKKPH